METIYIIISIVATLVTTLLPSIIALINACKAKHNAKTEAEAEKAKNAINAEIKNLVANAEVSFADIDKILKSQNRSAGRMKNRDVIVNLKAFCLENGYAWDDEAMKKAVEDEVAYTKTVNAK